MALPRQIILLAALSVATLALPAVAIAQVPATNASGGQYLPSVPGGGGNKEEGQLLQTGHGDAAGLKGVAGGDDAASSGARIGPLLPVALLASLLLTLAALAWRRRIA